MPYTKEQLDRASKLAMKGLKPPSGFVISAWHGLHEREFVPVKKTLTDKKRDELKVVKTKGGMK